MQNNHNIEDEVDLVALLKTIWQGKKTIVRFVTIFGLVGLFIAIFSAKEYTASVTLVPQIGGSKVSGNLGGLAAMAGINLGGGNEEGILPALYPKIVQSIPFKKELLKTSLNFSHLTKKVSYQEYYSKHVQFNLLRFIKDYTIGLPAKLIYIIGNKEPESSRINLDNISTVSEEEYQLYKRIEEQLIISLNEKEGYLELFFTMPEALSAAQMTKKSQELLQKAITHFKVQKSQEKLSFIEARFIEQETSLKVAQQELALYRDTNRGFSTSTSKTKLENLQANYNLIFGVYVELAKQLEAQKIQVKEDTPVFTIIEPVSIPVEKSKPKRIIILFVWGVLGIFIGIGVILGKNLFCKLKQKVN